MSLRRGSARAWDHAQLVHNQWLHAAMAQLTIWVKRVDTESNIADLPSRKVALALTAMRVRCLLRANKDFAALRRCGATELQPELWEEMQSWDELQERWGV